jgi:hypothetical protein
MDEIIGGRSIVPWTGGPVRQSSLPNEVDGPPMFQPSIPSEFCATITIQMEGATRNIDQSFSSAFIYGKRLTIEFADGYAQLGLNGELYGLADGYTTPDVLAAVTFTVTHTWGSENSWSQGIITTGGSIYNIGNAWGPSSQAMVDYHRWLMQINIANGGGSESEDVLGESLASYFFMNSAQWSQIQQIYDQLGSCQHLMYHFVGIHTSKAHILTLKELF